MTCPNCGADLGQPGDGPIRCGQCLLWWILADGRLEPTRPQPAREGAP